MTTTEQEPTALTREQLLGALDAEISHLSSSQTASGWTRWALILSIAALFSLGLEYWEKGGFTTKNVILLAVGFTIAWEFILKTVASVDKSLTFPVRRRAVHIFFPDLLGAMRSTILFEALKESSLLAAIFWVQMPKLFALQIYIVIRLFFSIFVFFTSYYDVPIIPPVDAEFRFPSLRVLLVSIRWIPHAAALASVVASVCSNPRSYNPSDVRISLVMTALAFLMTLLVNDRFPTNYTAAMQAIRQNVAFARIPIEEARQQADLLLIGLAPTQAFQRSSEEFFAAFEKTRHIVSSIDVAFQERAKITAELAESSLAAEQRTTKSAQLQIAMKSLNHLIQQAASAEKALQKRIGKSKSNYLILAFLSPTAAQEVAVFVDKLDDTIKPISDSIVISRKKLLQLKDEEPSQ